MHEPGPLLLDWHPDRNQGLRWQRAERAADPTTSCLWSHYRETAAITAPNNWSLPGAPLGGSMETPAMPRLLAPLARFDRGLQLYAELPAPDPGDRLVACAMRLGRAMLALELAAEDLKFSHQEAYEILCDVMGSESADVAKPFDLVGRWMGGTGILGITNERWVEVKAVLVLLSQLLAEPALEADPKELEGFAATLMQRAAAELKDPAPWFEALKAQMDPRSSLRSWIG
ncbi:MAG: hypothetical protein AB1758_28230 [Candidatus Eremiobacterota bacterium]